LVSAFITEHKRGVSAELLRRATTGRFEVYTSEAILAETRRVLLEDRRHLRRRYRYGEAAVRQWCEALSDVVRADGLLRRPLENCPDSASSPPWQPSRAPCPSRARCRSNPRAAEILAIPADRSLGPTRARVTRMQAAVGSRPCPDDGWTCALLQCPREHPAESALPSIAAEIAQRGGRASLLA
jgi:hypothetical protein